MNGKSKFLCVLWFLCIFIVGCENLYKPSEIEFVTLHINLPYVYDQKERRSYFIGNVGEDVEIVWKIGPDFNKNFSKTPIISFSDKNVLSLTSINLETQTGIVRIINKGESNISIKGDNFTSCSTMPIKVE